MDSLSDKELLADLGYEIEVKPAKALTARQERIIAGFEDIQRFYDEHGRAPMHGEDRDIFERLYAVRLDRIRDLEECRDLLEPLDRQGLIAMRGVAEPAAAFERDEDLLADLGVPPADGPDITRLEHVRSREEVRSAEDIANRKRCADFDTFKPLFEAVRRDLDSGARQSRRFGENANIKKGEFFIIGGQIAYIAEFPEEMTLTEEGRLNGRLRIIYDNGTEGDNLLRSFQRALYKDDKGRRITEPDNGPLFAGEADEEDLESGTVYVLRSQSNLPEIAANRGIIHKIGVTGGDVKVRLANAAKDATYLLADVEVVATYSLFNINRTRLEKLIHRVFADAQLDVIITDRFGTPVKPREWFLVPLPVIDQVIEKIRDQTISDYTYDPRSASLVRTSL